MLGALGLSKCRQLTELGAAVGRDQTAVVGIVDRQLAAGVRELVSRLRRGVEEDV